MMNKDDHELVLEVLRGSRSSFEILIERYQKKIYGMILQMTGDTETARDLTQEIFLKVYMNLPKFNFKYRFFSWLYRIMLNETINALKSKKHFLGLEKAQSIPQEEPAWIRESESNLKLRSAVKELRSDYRSLILLKYWYGLSYQEISETLHISVKKVKNRLFAARMAIRDKLYEKRYFEYD